MPKNKTKQKALKSPKKRKKVSKAKDGGKEGEKGDEEDKEEEGVEEGDKRQTESLTRKETKGFGMKLRDSVAGECREEKAPYVTVREAKMVTLADKVSNHSHHFLSCVTISRRQYNLLEVTYLT